MKTTSECFAEAARVISVDRRDQYAPAERNFGAIAEVWSGLLRKRYGMDWSLDAKDVGLLMAAMKLVREAWKHSDDNIIDCMGYTALVQELEGKAAGKPNSAAPEKADPEKPEYVNGWHRLCNSGVSTLRHRYSCPGQR